MGHHPLLYILCVYDEQQQKNPLTEYACENHQNLCYFDQAHFFFLRILCHVFVIVVAFVLFCLFVFLVFLVFSCLFVFCGGFCSSYTQSCDESVDQAPCPVTVPLAMMTSHLGVQRGRPVSRNQHASVRGRWGDCA